ncbi:MAG: histidine--tRNA ligase [Acidobacteria bacterium]|nr:histidine--tRNA ligase [Acidobacteriota bacterium]
MEPRLLKGFRDYLPEQMIARQSVINAIRNVYERYGFVPLDTPALEYTETLAGRAVYGTEGSGQIYTFQDRDNEWVSLRYDLTVPLSRVIALYKELPRPFRRYQVGPVWRVDKPGPGRYREFVQFDLDTVGCPDMLADAEILSAIHDVLLQLGLSRFRVRFSSRKVLNALIAFAGIDACRSHDVFRILDKLDRIGQKGIAEEMKGGRLDVSGDFIPGLGLSDSQVVRLLEFLNLPQPSRAIALDGLSQLFAGVANAGEGLDELSAIHEYLTALNIGDDQVAIDVSLARGLEYYTGPIFEAILLDAPEFGSIFGGGRYDGLVERFLGEKVPATGASIGVDRLLAAILKLGALELRPSTATVLVTVMDPQWRVEYQKITRELRQAGINTELYLGKEKGVGKQLQYANRQRIPIAVLLGADEAAQGIVSIKDLRVGSKAQAELKDRSTWLQARPGQFTVPRPQVVEAVRSILSG